MKPDPGFYWAEIKILQLLKDLEDPQPLIWLMHEIDSEKESPTVACVTKLKEKGHVRIIDIPGGTRMVAITGPGRQAYAKLVRDTTNLAPT